MSMIEVTAAEQATGSTLELYRRLSDNLGYLPNYAGIFGHRPELMAPIDALGAAARSPLPERLHALVNLAAARASNSSYCSLAFAQRLMRRHLTQKELLQVLTEPAQSPLSDRERAAMALAGQVARDASQVGQEHIRRMRDAGFDDRAIFDVVVAAAWRCFFSRIPEALGAMPDRALGRMAPELLALLLVGRPLEDGREQERAGAEPPVEPPPTLRNAV